MNIHVSGTSDVDQSLIVDVVEILRHTDGSVFDFLPREPISPQIQGLLNPSLKEINKTSFIGFSEMLDLCENSKVIEKIPEEDFYVLLTGLKVSGNWFSAFRKKVVFVDIHNWELFIDGDEKYGIAHQIIENVFQSLIDLKIENGIDPLIHKDRPIGCINDFCGEKKDIEYKLMTARICSKCLKRAYEKIEDKTIVMSIKNHFESIRNVLLNNSQNQTDILPPLKIKDNGRIFVHNTDLKLEPIQRATYLLFVEELNGIDVNHIHNKVLRLNSLYKFIGSKRYDDFNFPDRFGFEFIHVDKISEEKKKTSVLLPNTFYYLGERDPKKDTFKGIISDIKKKFSKKLGKPLFEKYIINKEDKYYKINLTEDSIIIEIELPKSAS